MGNVRSMACIWVIACAPQPTSPRMREVGLASTRLAIADEAPVRNAVRKVPSARPARWPVAVS